MNQDFINKGRRMRHPENRCVCLNAGQMPHRERDRAIPCDIVVLQGNQLQQDTGRLDSKSDG